MTFTPAHASNILALCFPPGVFLAVPVLPQAPKLTRDFSHLSLSFEIEIDNMPFSLATRTGRYT